MIIFARAPGTTGWVEIKPEEELSHRGQFWEIRKFAVESGDALPLARRLDRAEQALRAAGFQYHGPSEKWLAPKDSGPVKEPNGWKPISSAPRDGRNILVRFGKDGVSQAKFIAGLPFPWQFIDTNDGVTWLINHARDALGGPSHWAPFPNFSTPVAQEGADA